MKNSQVFVRDAEYAWLPAEKLGGDDSKARVKIGVYPTEQSIACDGGAGAKDFQEEEVVTSDVFWILKWF